jgi:hypothetical protein
MPLTKAIQHNQSLFIAALISILCFATLISCHLTQAQKKEIISQAVPIAEAVASGTPIPWEGIGLAISTILGSGAIVDNRRKDVLIKRLKTENANLTTINATILSTKYPDPPNRPPLCNN